MLVSSLYKPQAQSCHVTVVGAELHAARAHEASALFHSALACFPARSRRLRRRLLLPCLPYGLQQSPWQCPAEHADAGCAPAFDCIYARLLCCVLRVGAREGLSSSYAAWLLTSIHRKSQSSSNCKHADISIMVTHVWALQKLCFPQDVGACSESFSNLGASVL